MRKKKKKIIKPNNPLVALVRFMRKRVVRQKKKYYRPDYNHFGDY